jgi:hypothetical protein
MSSKLSIFLVAVSLLLTACLSDDETFASRAIVTKTPGTVVLSWSPSFGNPQGYKVEESTNGIDFNQIQMVTVPSATITPLTTAKYYFRIRSYNEAGDSGYSSVITATVNE